MRKRDELNHPNSCLNKAADNELLFVLLARDRAAPATVRFWVEERLRLGLNAPGDAKLAEAVRCAETMEADRQAERRIWLAEKASRGPLSPAEAAEFAALQEGFFAALAVKHPRPPDVGPQVEELARRLEGKEAAGE